MQNTLLNMNNLNLMETILKPVRERLKENDQMDTAGEIAGPTPEIPFECKQILKE